MIMHRCVPESVEMEQENDREREKERKIALVPARNQTSPARITRSLEPRASKCVNIYSSDWKCALVLRSMKHVKIAATKWQTVKQHGEGHH